MSKLLVASGLVLVTGPLSFQAQAQDYVDVEAERSGRTTPAAPAAATPGSPDPYARPSEPYSSTPSADPYSVQPSQSYPATSYGLNNAPAGPAVAAPMTSPAAQTGGQNMGTLYIQFQQLQQEVMRLNGIVEEQANELRKLKSQSLERYVDLDKRLSAVGAGAVVVGSNSGGSSATVPGSTASSGSTKAAELPGEAEAYRSAYALVRGQQFGQAVESFQKFLSQYPDGKYAANAHYWLGELYLVIDPPDLEASRQAFTLLLDQYPDNPKAPDAMYKLGKVQFLKGNREKSREYLDRVILDYGNTNSSAVKLSKDFIAENF